MEQKSITITYREYVSDSELENSDKELLEAARGAARNAYAPYSGFSVGAALRLESGIIVRGTNVENAAFPSGICAERSAIAAAVSNYPGDRPVILAIAAFTSEGETEEPVTPCGNCRQVISEEETKANSKIRIILGGRKRIISVEGIDNLLPLQFNKNSLKITRP